MASHRADKRAALRRRPAHAPTPGGHAAVRARRVRRERPSRLSGGALVGVVTVGLAAAGTLTLASSGAGRDAVATASSSAFSVEPGTVGTGSALSTPSSTPSPTAARPAPAVEAARVDASLLSGRQRAVSRDSQRYARADAADESLQAAAERQAKKRNAELAAQAADARKQAVELARNAWELPVTSGAYRLTSRFGECSSLWSSCHTGLDFAAPSGTPIRAVAAGTVTEVGSEGAYGNRTVVRLEDGTEVWYCHQAAYSVDTGQRVTAGQVIGSVGSTGNTTGPHLHLEVRPGAEDPVDPAAALAAHGLTP